MAEFVLPVLLGRPRVGYYQKW